MRAARYAAGFTTVRNLGSTGGTDRTLQAAIEGGRVAGPRMLIAGPGLGPTGGVCDQVFAGEGRIDSANQAGARIDALVRAGAGVIKVCAGGGVIPGQPDEEALEMSEEVMAAVVAAARKRGLSVAAHAQGPRAIAAAIRAGVASSSTAASSTRRRPGWRASAAWSWCRRSTAWTS